MATNIDVVLNAVNETTPTWKLGDILEDGAGHNLTAGVYIQGIRVSGTTTIRLDFEVAVIGKDGSLFWKSVANFNVASGTGANTVTRRTDMHAGCLYRVRYQTSATNDIRVRVALGDD